MVTNHELEQVYKHLCDLETVVFHHADRALYLEHERLKAVLYKQVGPIIRDKELHG